MSEKYFWVRLEHLRGGITGTDEGRFCGLYRSNKDLTSGAI